METKVDGEALRRIMRRVPSPVIVVTAAGEKETRGITIGSFTSVSLNPPLISFNISLEAQMYEVITTASRFAVHLLSDQQAYLSNHFAIADLPGVTQFASVPYRLDSTGVTPVLEDVLAVLYCNRYAVHEAGDHVIVLGEVTGIEEGDEGRPILYYNRSYRKVGDVVKPSLFNPVKRTSRETL